MHARASLYIGPPIRLSGYSHLGPFIRVLHVYMTYSNNLLIMRPKMFKRHEQMIFKDLNHIQAIIGHNQVII